MLEEAEKRANIIEMFDRVDEHARRLLVAHVSRNGLPRNDKDQQDLCARAFQLATHFDSGVCLLRNNYLQQHGMEPES